MNCKLAQKIINDNLASAAPGIPSETRAHCEYCPECRAFYQKERNLYSALEKELGNIMNPAVPASLAPGVRVRLKEAPVRQSVWVPRLVFAATAMAVLLVCVNYLGRKLEGQPRAAHIEVISRQESGPALRTSPPAKPLVAAKPQTGKRRNSRPPLEALPEVIVPSEERQAFARFVARVPEERDVAVALVRAASVEADAPIEIALLDLGSIEVKPLEPETAD